MFRYGTIVDVIANGGIGRRGTTPNCSNISQRAPQLVQAAWFTVDGAEMCSRILLSAA